MVSHISFPRLGLELDVRRSLFSVFGMPIYTYGILIALGLCLAYLYAIREIKKTDISTDDFFNMFLMGLPAAIIGARIYYVAFTFDAYRGNPIEIFNIRGGGLAVYGGIIGAAAVVLIYCRIKKIRTGAVLDILSVGLLIGQAIGRWGNFVNGEAFGSECSLPWAMTVVQNGRTIAEAVHPTFIYESLFNAIGILVLCAYKRRQRFDGELFCGYMLWYGTGRFFIEGLRADSLYIGGFRVSQLLSAALAAAGLILIVKNRKKT